MLYYDMPCHAMIKCTVCIELERHIHVIVQNFPRNYPYNIDLQQVKLYGELKNFSHLDS